MFTHVHIQDLYFKEWLFLQSTYEGLQWFCVYDLSDEVDDYMRIVWCYSEIVFEHVYNAYDVM